MSEILVYFWKAIQLQSRLKWMLRVRIYIIARSLILLSLNIRDKEMSSPVYFKSVIDLSRVPMDDRLFPDNSTLKLRNFADEIVRSNLAVAKGLGEQKGATIALFNWRLSKVIILSATARISLLRERLKGDNRNRPPNTEEGLDCRCTLCGQHYSSTVSTSPNRRFCRLPFLFRSLTQAQLLLDTSHSRLSRILQSTFCILAVYTRDYSEFQTRDLFIIFCPRSLLLPIFFSLFRTASFFPDNLPDWKKDYISILTIINDKC